MARRLTHRRWVFSAVRLPVEIRDAWTEASQLAGCSQSKFLREALKRRQHARDPPSAEGRRASGRLVSTPSAPDSDDDPRWNVEVTATDDDAPLIPDGEYKAASSVPPHPPHVQVRAALHTSRSSRAATAAPGSTTSSRCAPARAADSARTGRSPPASGPSAATAWAITSSGTGCFSSEFAPSKSTSSSGSTPSPTASSSASSSAWHERYFAESVHLASDPFLPFPFLPTPTLPIPHQLLRVFRAAAGRS